MIERSHDRSRDRAQDRAQDGWQGGLAPSVMSEMSGDRPQDAAPRRRRLLGWWYRLATPAPVAPSAPLAARERERRTQLAATLLLAFIAITLLGLPIGFTDPATLHSLLASYLLSAIMVVLNRTGRVEITAIMLVIISDAVLLLAILGAPNGLELIYVPLFDFMVIAELFAVSLLPPVSVFGVAVLNSGIIIADVYLQPHTDAFAATLASPDIYPVIVRPIALHLIIAVVSYLWVTSSQRALRRADRAEELAAAERREVERTRAMEQGVREVLATHVQVANGNFRARVPQLAEPLLWQIGASLNTLISRLTRLATAEYTLQRTADETHRLGEALRDMVDQRPPLWPAPSGTPVDELLPPLQRLVGTGPTGRFRGGPGGPGGPGDPGGGSSGLAGPAHPYGALGAPGMADRRSGYDTSTPGRPPSWPSSGTPPSPSGWSMYPPHPGGGPEPFLPQQTPETPPWAAVEYPPDDGMPAWLRPPVPPASEEQWP